MIYKSFALVAEKVYRFERGLAKFAGKIVKFDAPVSKYFGNSKCPLIP